MGVPDDGWVGETHGKCPKEVESNEQSYKLVLNSFKGGLQDFQLLRFALIGAQTAVDPLR